MSLPVAALILAALVIADFYVPVLPSATTLATLAGLLAGDLLLIAALIAWAAAASWLGDLLGYQVLRRARTHRPIRPSSKAARLERRLRATLMKRPCATTVLARFLPAGRTALAWAAVAAPDYRHARMSALGAVVWACGTVGVGLLIGRVFGAGLMSAAAAATSVAAVSVVLGWWYAGSRPERVDGTVA
ncbi:hypothetical protein [Glycomyces sp. NRRL B-16210]|uniref:hypothetical protein n=1 Tax=Glycomyces sp. NRRL B-16210 TaxID=1463821 RepID=UPI00068D6B9E|nr:hypothetical protein [Glycomyces sp. NRRL B-16210]